ncbi:flagellar biosynthesis protein FlhF [Anaeromyxobacter paludicola]|uniref:Flagellar biosynthesis protein FlhF n=1 Tax=Anaeromyxobacter paludicola TaxID=2918171 RepID=A0ABN6N4A0_9BACT|nr:flagellar biosynthesis protein FlhF [Anaeromyxobacter paludicola]BDG07999.1 hypothetical protein AMPC_11120 [Anaeromyxobacter paludicola]
MYQPSRRTAPPPNATVRTFRAADTASALAAVKAALGPDAVILDTRSVDRGLFRRPEVEVTAGLELPEAGLSAVPAAPALPQRPSPAVLAPAADAPAPLARPAAELPAPVEVRPAPAFPPAPAPVPAARPPRPALRGFGADEPFPEEPPAGAEELGEDEMADGLRRSFEEARRALALMARRARASGKPRLPPGAQSVEKHLLDCGVDPALAEELVTAAVAAGGGRKAAVLARVRTALEGRLPVAPAPWLAPGRQVIAFVGPTGVGKTTTLAKVAARALLESRKRIALLTVDTYRIGACDQLARYGEIMGVPVLVARDRTELARAMERVGQADMVLVDTAGRSSIEDVERQTDLVRSVPGIELHLVASAAAGGRQLAAVGDRYRAIQPDRLVFTKLDEAAGPGGILALAARVDRPVACIADGQRVPEDLHAFDSAKLVELVLTSPEGALR